MERFPSVLEGEAALNERIPCEFFLVRYVPDPVKGEFVNIGVVLREAGSAPRQGPVVRFTREWSRVRCIDPDADVGLLEGFEAEIAARLAAEQALGAGALAQRSVLSGLFDTLSNSIQITEPRACLAETRALEHEQLMRLYVEPLRLTTERRRPARAQIAASMRREFEQAGVWAMMRKRISTSRYTRPGDPMKIDCGYRPNGVIRMFHAVSLANDVEAAKGLAYTAPRLREGVSRVEEVALELTAVVEPLREVSAEGFEDEATERYRFGVETMELEDIRVITVNDLARAAAKARVELRI
jgi:hypothetical protein